MKARQLGMSTYAVLDILDDALFTRNLACGIVSYSIEHAQHIFKRIIGHALDTFPKDLQPFIGIKTRSAREIVFSNGSFLRVDTTLRGGSYLCVLISEFGKTCSRSPIKAEEIVTGTIQAVPPQGKLIIESTGEGNEGFYADMCYGAIAKKNESLNELDYRFFFYPWYVDPLYALSSKVTYEIELDDYFDKIEQEASVKISRPQRYWYAHQRSLLGDKIQQEYPSTPSEAFLSSSDAYYFAKGIEKAYQENRCQMISSYDALAPVYVAADIGVNDLTVLIFFQLIHGEIRVIDYYEDSNKGVEFYARFLLQDKKYIIHTICLPHDAGHRDGIIVENTYERDFRKYFKDTQTRFHVLKKSDKNMGINNAKMKLDRCVFNLNKTKGLIEHLQKYRKKWSEQYGKYLDEPFHDTHSNFADSFRYSMMFVSHLELVTNQSDAYAKHKAAVQSRSTRI